MKLCTPRAITRLSLVLSLLCATLACAADVYDTPPAADANAGVDSLNARLSKAYRDHDPVAYGALFTDSAVFEWPAVATVKGRPALEAMARESWPSLPEMELRLIVASRRIAAEHATEFGAFEQSWRDSTGGRTTEHGRYVALLARQPDDSWRMDRFFGFSDSTRSARR